MTKYNLIPAVFLLLGTIFAFLLGNAVDRSQMQKLALETRITTEQIRLRLESCLNSRIAVVNQLAEPRWANQDALRRDWVDEADLLVNLFPGIQALNYVDNDWVIDMIYPVAPNAPALGANLHHHPAATVADSLGTADRTGRLARTNVIQLLQSGDGIAMYQKIRANDGTQLGFVNGVFRVSDLIETCLSEQELRNRFNLRLGEIDGSLVYQSSAPVNADTVSDANHAAAVVDVAGRPWRLDLVPTPEFLVAASNGVEDAWFYVGILLVLLLAASSRSLLMKQESLRDSQEKYRLLVENQSDMVVKVNTDSEFLYVSPSYCHTFGKSESELLGRKFLPVIHEEDRTPTQESFDNISARSPHSYYEHRARTKEGWRWLAWSYTGLFDKHNKLQAITAVGRDITDVKKLKDDIAHNQKMQAIGEMASGITHDFNNLLQVMMANIEFLIRGSKGNEKARGQLEKIQKALERARNLIGKLSTLSKQELLIRNVVDLNQHTAEVIEMFRQSLPEKVSITFQDALDKLPVEVDASQFERVLFNLFFNATEAMHEQGIIRVTVGKRHLDAEFCSAHKPAVLPGEYAWITIEDTGHGIPAESLSRIFDPFYSTKSRGSSGGLGLANSYSIIKQLDGLIDVESTENVGTTFTIYLPLIEKAESIASTGTNAPDEPAEYNRKMILIADDEPELLDVTNQILQDNGYETLTATNGKQALQLYNKHGSSIALVIMDLVMPVMSGQQSAFEIRKTSPTAKILFISGYIPESEGRTIRLDGPLLRKPFRSTSLLDKVTSILHPQ